MNNHSDDDESGEESHGVNDNFEVESSYGIAGSEDEFDHHYESESSVYYGSGSGSSSSVASEDRNAKDEEREQFAMNFHRGNNDGEIDSALSSVADLGRLMDMAADQPRPPNWEQLLMDMALKNQREQLRGLAEGISTSSVDVGLIGPFDIESWERTKHYYEGEPLASHEQPIASYWDVISKAVAQRENIIFSGVAIRRMQLTKAVMKMLAKVLILKVTRVLTFDGANLCGEGIKSLSTLLDNNPEVTTLELRNNPIEDLNAIRCLSKSVNAHSELVQLHIAFCDLGNNVDALAAICHNNMKRTKFDNNIPQSNVKDINLENNNIGSVGARVIAECLQTNPRLCQLTLRYNHFDDDDAILFSKCLKKNSNLLRLYLQENKFTSSGVKSLIAGVFDSSSLNAISGSNHICRLHLLPDSSIVQDCIYHLRRLSRKGKVLLALHARESLLKYTEDVPEELMPDVLAFLQAEEDQRKLLNMIYATMRWWSMPSLYSYHSEPKNPKRKRGEVE